jgi:hypothetical protein
MSLNLQEGGNKTFMMLFQVSLVKGSERFVNEKP